MPHDEWARREAQKPRWHLAIALLWIAERNLLQVRGDLPFEFEGMGAGSIIAYVDLHLHDRLDLADRYPHLSLVTALRVGAVRGCGFRNSNLSAWGEISPEDWGFLTLRDGGGYPKPTEFQACAFYPRPDEYWSGLTFDREGLTASFPPITANTIEAQAQPSNTSVEAPETARRRPAEAEANRQFGEWCEALSASGGKPTRHNAEKFARSIGMTREWARAKLNEIEPAMRYAPGRRSSK